MCVPKEFVMGMMFGVGLAYVFTQVIITQKLFVSFHQLPTSVRAGQVPHVQGGQPSNLMDSTLVLPVPSTDDQHFHNDDDSEARRLAKDVRVLIWVMTQPRNLHKAKMVRDTWGRRANRLLLFSSETDASLPAIGLNVTEGRSHTTMKCQASWQYVYKHHFDDADWFMKADDDTYVILENLRHFLSGENSSDPVFFGHHFNTLTTGNYFSGGGGYVVSKAALQRYGEKGSEIFTLCKQDGSGEDWKWSNCMTKLGVRVGNSTDALGRTRFHCFDPKLHLSGDYPDWYYKQRNNTSQKENGISDYAISFHYVTPEMMQEMEFYVYHLGPYGIVKGRQNLNRPRRQSGMRQSEKEKDRE